MLRKVTALDRQLQQLVGKGRMDFAQATKVVRTLIHRAIPLGPGGHLQAFRISDTLVLKIGSQADIHETWATYTHTDEPTRSLIFVPIAFHGMYTLVQAVAAPVGADVPATDIVKFQRFCRRHTIIDASPDNMAVYSGQLRLIHARLPSVVTRRKNRSPHADRLSGKPQPCQQLNLTAAEEQFCRIKASNPTLSGVAIVKQIPAYHHRSRSAQSNVAHNLLRRPQIQDRLAQLQADAIRQLERKHRYRLTHKNILKTLASVAFSDITDIVTVDAEGHVAVKPSSEWTARAAAAVQSIVNGIDGPKLVMHNKVEAASKLAKIFKLIPAESAPMQIGRAAVVYIPANGRPLQAHAVGRELGAAEASLIDEHQAGEIPAPARAD
jgi:hypothetical protein